jgi:hypothetical protein
VLRSCCAKESRALRDDVVMYGKALLLGFNSDEYFERVDEVGSVFQRSMDLSQYSALEEAYLSDSAGRRSKHSAMLLLVSAERNTPGTNRLCRWTVTTLGLGFGRMKVCATCEEERTSVAR